MGESTDERTKVERTSDTDLYVTRTFDAPPRIVFQAWTTPELFQRWWAPKSSPVPIFACDMDVRTGGTYRLEFGHDASETFAFFGKYLEVVPNERIVWTNEEGEQSAVTTVTFEDRGGQTLLVMHEVYPTREGLDEAFIGMEGATPEQFGQLDDLLAELGAKAGGA